jgi:hypothetical protein
MITLPSRYDAWGATTYCADRALGYDWVARAALESRKNSYQPMPTGSSREFGQFFSEANLKMLEREIQRRSGFPMERGAVIDAMMNAFSMIQPRSDQMDTERRLDFSQAAIDSYVTEMNRYVLENTVEENKQANKLWDWYSKYRNVPCELPDDCDVDTRSRFTASLYPFDWTIPDD